MRIPVIEEYLAILQVFKFFIPVQQIIDSLETPLRKTTAWSLNGWVAALLIHIRVLLVRSRGIQLRQFILVCTSITDIYSYFTQFSNNDQCSFIVTTVLLKIYLRLSKSVVI